MITVKPGFNETAQIARKTIPFMSEKRIGISPRNYMIWYEYFAGTMDELKEQLDNFLKANRVIDEKLMDQVYGQFFVRDSKHEDERKLAAEMEAVANAHAKAKDILNPLTENLTMLSTKNESYSNKLDEYADGFADVGSADDIEETLQALTAETREIASQNRTLSKDLSAYSSQLEELQTDLQQAQEEARVDDLTHIANRRSFNEKLIEELEWVLEERRFSSLILFDIDHFKQINDSFGHPVGDKALQVIASIISQTIEGQASLFRYGGEEFALIIRDSDITPAVELANRVRVAVDENIFSVRGKEIDISISGGVALIQLMRSVDESLTLTDEALYLAKKSGRNNIKSENDLTSP